MIHMCFGSYLRMVQLCQVSSLQDMCDRFYVVGSFFHPPSTTHLWSTPKRSSLNTVNVLGYSILDVQTNTTDNFFGKCKVSWHYHIPLQLYFGFIKNISKITEMIVSKSFWKSTLMLSVVFYLLVALFHGIYLGYSNFGAQRKTIDDCFGIYKISCHHHIPSQPYFE